MGRVLVVGGSRDLAGAPTLAGLGALHAGAGLVRVAVPRAIQSIVSAHSPDLLTAGLPSTRRGGLAERALGEVLRLAESADAVVLGPGAGREASTSALLRRLTLALVPAVVVDADALAAWVGGLKRDDRPAKTRVFTPHEGEAARLLGISAQDVRRDRRAALRGLVEATGAVVVLKGPATLVGEGRRVFTCARGGPVLATGGSGDVLAGVIAALLAEAAHAPFDCAATGVEWHARAGEVATRGDPGRRGVPASTLATLLPEARRSWLRTSVTVQPRALAAGRGSRAVLLRSASLGHRRARRGAERP